MRKFTLLGVLVVGAGAVLAGGAERLAALPGPPLDATRPVRELQLAAAVDGSLTLAVITDAHEANSGRGTFTARHVRAWRARGNAWVPLGGVLNYDTPRPVSSLNLALDKRGTPILVWNENYGDNDIVVFRAFRGGAWTDWRSRYIGDDLPYAARTRAVAARAGEPVIAWGEYRRKPDGSLLTVRTWDGASWTRGDPFNDFTAFSRQPSMALDALGRPVVAWLQGAVLASDVFVKRWTGSAWHELGGRVNRHASTYLAGPRLALDRQDRPVLAWLEDTEGRDTLYASRWTGARWEPLGGAVSREAASAAALTLTAEGHPVLAWVEERGGIGRIHLARWTGRTWQHHGPLNASPSRDARSPVVATEASGTVVVAWREDTRGVYAVQLRRFRE